MVDDVVGSFIEAKIVLVFIRIVIVVEIGHLSDNYQPVVCVCNAQAIE
jgi:hypothetical protein